MDFTDLIELSYKNVDAPVGKPSIGFFDEVQDFTPLELSLVRKWGKSMEYLVLAGDDDQCIYSFKGATPSAFLLPDVPADNKRVLSESYRVPQAVQTVAQQWVDGLRQREVKEYKARKGAEGQVRYLPYGIRNASALLKDAEQYISEGKRVMFLTACSFMLEPLKAELRRQSLPYYNPYRVSRGDWNPLTPGKGISSVERLLSFLMPSPEAWGEAARMWRRGDFDQWFKILKKAGVARKGSDEALLKIHPLEEMTVQALLEIMEPDAVTAALDSDIEWFKGHLLKAKAAPMDFPISIAQRRGAAVLHRTPQVIIGTIHSVKGGEADCVYLCPDLSPSGAREWAGEGELHDAVIRQFYVGMTRARETLVICQPSTGYFVSGIGGKQ
jgi:superfamily I DNA/RNA helicase